jgi:hypothetical protein
VSILDEYSASNRCKCWMLGFASRTTTYARLIDPLWNDNAIFTQQPPNLAARGRALPHPFAPDPVDRLHVLLFHALDLHEPHVGPAYRFADPFGVVRVVLLTLYIRLDELGPSSGPCAPSAETPAPNGAPPRTPPSRSGSARVSRKILPIDFVTTADAPRLARSDRPHEPEIRSLPDPTQYV